MNKYAEEFIKKTVMQNAIVLFMKGTAQSPQCGFSARAIQILKNCGVKSATIVNVLGDLEIREGIKRFSKWPTIPQLYVNKEFIGGCDIMHELHTTGQLKEILSQIVTSRDYQRENDTPNRNTTR